MRLEGAWVSGCIQEGLGMRVVYFGWAPQAKGHWIQFPASLIPRPLTKKKTQQQRCLDMRLIPSKSRLFPFLPITPNVSLDSYICSLISPLLIIVHVSMSYYITRSPESTMEFCVFITFTSVCQFVWDPIHLHTMHSRCLVITPKI